MDVATLPCPGCGARLSTNTATLGKRVRCPKCQHIFTAAASPTQDAAQVPPRTAGWSPTPGERVFALWPDGFCYPARVQSSDAQSVRVNYDDGATALVAPDEVHPARLQPGDRVFVRWQGEPAYYPAYVTQVAGEQIDVDYDDGASESSSLSMVRVVRGELPWQVGDRVLANWPPEPFFYPAEIAEITDGVFLNVAYDDGDSAELLPPQVRPLDLCAGDRVYARWRDGPNYFPWRIAEMNGAEIHVHYDDGETEWTTIGVVRVLPEELVRPT